MSDRDYSVRLDAPEVFKVKGITHQVMPLPEAVGGDVGYYTIGNTIVLELVGTVHTSAGPDFSSALNALRAEVLKAE
ncbi:hypothetical protein IACHDJAJ_00059 [Aeromonas phage vB_AdhS_TS3]|nr:hypothetical protein IACHDJAJ_00059 [Aeromonas phage vB_AdhS_TS3]